LNYFPELASKLDPPYLCLLRSQYYRHKPPALGIGIIFFKKEAEELYTEKNDVLMKEIEDR
jgi:hypothetical protein